MRVKSGGLDCVAPTVGGDRSSILFVLVYMGHDFSRNASSYDCFFLADCRALTGSGVLLNQVGEGCGVPIYSQSHPSR